MKQRIYGVIVLIFLTWLAIWLFLKISDAQAFSSRSVREQPGLLEPRAFLPLIANRSHALLTSPLCRLGVNQVNRSPADYLPQGFNRLRAGWYFNWSTSLNPARPNGIMYAQSIFVKQWKWDNGQLVLYHKDAPYAQPYTYTVRPSIPQIKQIAIANPGSLWLIGNEIERRDWGNSPGQGQQEILPEVYAAVYHEIYTAIKEADPMAKVANGSIIVPTPLRLEYMTRVWNEYLRLYGEPMPVDVWQIHVYLGPEKRNYWGIDIPAGIDADVGMFYFGENDPRNILVNKDFSYVPDLVRAFRVWMKERGQQNKPLFITEFGVSMPDWVLPGEFTWEKIRDEYMYPGLNFLLNAKDSELGYPADDYRLVQSVWWWSLDGDGGEYEGNQFYQYFNSNLFWSGIGPPTHSPNPIGLTPLGNDWINYTSRLPEEVNLRPLAATADLVPFSNGEPVTVTVRVQVSNSGNVTVGQPFDVTMYDNAGQQIGSFRVNSLEGCGEVSEALIIWPNVAPGTHTIRIQVDPTNEILETREDDNDLSALVLVATSRINLPVVLKGWLK
ncbi:MAG: CARDB domain-containing protein [Anaerolineae bacterium]